MSDVPAELLLRSQDHLDELVRELQIVAIGVASGTATAVPRSIAELLRAILDRYAEVRGLSRALALRTLERGADTVTIDVRLPPAAADDLRRIMELVDEADRLCQEGDLLTLASPPDVRDFRRRVVDEVLRQLES